MLVADCVSSQCSGEAFRPHFLRREGGDFLDCSVGGLCVGSTADGLRCRGAGVPALPDQLCSDGFCGDSATAATLGPASPMTKRTPWLVQVYLQL